jgi:hypothetical protein
MTLFSEETVCYLLLLGSRKDFRWFLQEIWLKKAKPCADSPVYQVISYRLMVRSLPLLLLLYKRADGSSRLW